MKRVASLVNIIDLVNTGIAKVTSFLVIFIMAILLFGVIMRYVFRQALFWEGDISWIMFVACSVLAGAYVLRQDGHVRMDLFYNRLSPKRKAILDSITFVFFLLFLGVLSWLTINKAIWSISVLEKSGQSYFHGPIYLVRASLALGCVLLLLQGIAEFIRRIAFLCGYKIEERHN